MTRSERYNKEAIEHYKRYYGYRSELEQYVAKYPNKPWDWQYLSANPQISIEFIMSHPEMPWRYNWVIINPNVTDDTKDLQLHLIVLGHFYANYNPNATCVTGTLGNPANTYEDIIQCGRHNLQAVPLNPAITTAQFFQRNQHFHLKI